ncbi:MAG TPA: zinc ribbon domain-containing protein [Verrucomicrobiae bacterium]|nr:zinc ribbon domain-containing protein [Verrucomicrobiae bacterium]
MKVCSYCGHNNPEEAQTCADCGLDLPANPIPPSEPAREGPRKVSTPVTSERPVLLSAGFFENAEPLDVSKIDMGFSFEVGFSWPDWKKIRQSIQTAFPKDQWPQAWREAGILWITQLKEDLGGNYERYESWNFLLLSAEGEETSDSLLKIAEQTVEVVECGLNFSTRRELYGKRVILAFNEEDDYYSYISHFYSEGNFSRSGGMFIQTGGYAHVAFPFIGMQYVPPVLAHELTHNCLMDLHMPRWLNEGLTMRVEKQLNRSYTTRGFNAPAPILDRELAQAHHALWNEKNIQEFWGGSSFFTPGDINKLSYNLAEIMVELLSDNWTDFLNFVQNADPCDAGQDAALKCLDCDLGETLARFLGPGQWRPNRKAIADLWNEKRHEGNHSSYTAD